MYGISVIPSTTTIHLVLAVAITPHWASCPIVGIASDIVLLVNGCPVAVVIVVIAVAGSDNNNDGSKIRC